MYRGLFDRNYIVNADDLQDVVISELKGIERYSNTFNSNKPDDFLADLSNVAREKREAVEALGKTPFVAPSI